MIWFGVISEVKNDKARVAVGELTTDYLPVFQMASSFKRSWTPIKEKEQCIILSPCGDINSGCILRGLYYSSYSAPSNDNNVEVAVYSDGTKVSYSTADSTLKINAVKTIKLICKNVSIDCENAIVNAKTSTLIDSPSVDIGATGGSGVVTQNCNCMLTGIPHAFGSKKVRAT